MNIFSNIGITELLFILLLALLVVGPERLPELAQKLGKTLRDLRKAYENLTRDLGPELTSIQKSTQELRESVESVRSIPEDMVKSLAKAADLDETIEELKGVTKDVGQIGQAISDTKRVIQHPVGAAVDVARGSLTPRAATSSAEAGGEADPTGVLTGAGGTEAIAETAGAHSPLDGTENIVEATGTQAGEEETEEIDKTAVEQDHE
jgi:sec-independent protein translocase protein TatB